jgi:four helix bundle protein
MNNIVEGFDSGSSGEFIQFLAYAKRSASEVQSCLYLSLDRGYISQAEFQEAYDQAGRTRTLITGFIRYLRQAPNSTAETARRRHAGTPALRHRIR